MSGRYAGALRLVVPQQQQISGGRVVNTELRDALARAGWEIDERELAGAWPWPTAEQRAAVRTALTTPVGDPASTAPASPAPLVLVDGLIGSACPAEIEAASAAGVRVAVLVHLPLPAETGLSPEQQESLAALERRALDAAAAVLTTSHWAAQDLRRRYGLPAVRVLTPGARRQPLADGSEPPQLLLLGALTPVKNHATALAALGTLTDLPWRALVVGAGRVAGVRETLRPSALAERVTLTGELTGNALDDVWRGTDLLLVPSWTETFGLVVTEALARGIPAVVSRGTGAVEALSGHPAAASGGTVGALGNSDPAPARPVGESGRSELAGAVADPGDPSEWTATLRGWLTDTARRDRWRHRALRRRTELRTWADTADDLVRVMEELT
ncbi:glycosyltransferase family 4 protein [Granulicoccus sp. GXG6511]|uniref:glycosyltransferase family 4 protein n=1 Tax=Granulicoccus sp. GXG6511 TaxID=3381351 RepID=UPI003D7C78F9